MDMDLQHDAYEDVMFRHPYAHRQLHYTLNLLQVKSIDSLTLSFSLSLRHTLKDVFTFATKSNAESQSQSAAASQSQLIYTHFQKQKQKKTQIGYAYDFVLSKM